MLINAGWSVALYCQYCGKIEINDISYFDSQKGIQLLKCSCHHVKAKLVRTDANQIKLQIPCGACGALHEARFNRRRLLRTRLEPVHCFADNFELGYVGKRDAIKEFLAYNKREFDTMNKACSGEEIEKQLILLEILNKLHDLAESDGVVCGCGKQELDADIVGDSILLECRNCGSFALVPAITEEDLQKMNNTEKIELSHGRFLARF